MATELKYQYDPIGDILYIDRVAPYKGQVSDDLGDEVVARFNPVTSQVENLEILFFSKRLSEATPFESFPRVPDLAITPDMLAQIALELDLRS